MRISAFLFGIVGLASLLPASAGEKKEFQFPNPGPEHKILAGLEGTFDAKVKSWFGPGEPTESTGVMKRQMILDGRYLQEHYDGKLLDKSFRGMSIVGFDVRKKKYVNAWVDSLSTSIATMEGTYDAATKTLTTFGEDYAPGSDKKMKSKDVLKIVDADTQLFEMYRQPEGAPKEFKVLEIAYKRRK